MNAEAFCGFRDASNIIDVRWYLYINSQAPASFAMLAGASMANHPYTRMIAEALAGFVS